MAYLSTRGLVLYAKTCRESDRNILILTPDHGQLYAYAHRAAKSQTCMSAGTQPFMLCDFTLTQKKGFYSVQDLEIVASFPGLQAHIERLIVAAHMVDVARDVAVDVETGYHLYELLGHALYILSSGAMDERLVAATFNWKVIALAGYAPDIHSHVGKKALFSLDDGRLYPPTAPNLSHSRRVHISQSSILALRFVLDQPCAKAFSYHLDSSHMTSFFDLSSQYLCDKLDKEYKQLPALRALYELPI